MKEEIDWERYEKANQFYDNHLFTKADLKRVTFGWRERLWLWMYPTYVQLSEGFEWHYKLARGRYYLMKVKDFKP